VVKRLRAVLGDDAAQPRFVETLPRQGYRFIGALEGGEPRPRGSSAAPRPRLVVLPFTNLTGDPSHDFFIDGFTEELIAQLGHRCADRVGVLARTSAMLYKDVRRGAGDIGEALRADYLVEGSVRTSGDRVRITAQLIETRGETHLWAHSYDRDYRNCLTSTDRVAAEIAVALERELFPPPAARTRRRPRARRLRGLPHRPLPLEPLGSGRASRPPSPSTIRRSATIPASAAPIRRAPARCCRCRSTTSCRRRRAALGPCRGRTGPGHRPDDADAWVVIAEAAACSTTIPPAPAPPTRRCWR
jgi:TolB-like protein